MRVARGMVVTALLGGLVAAPAAQAAKPKPKPKPRLAISVLSSRPELVSAGDALVRIAVPRRVDAARVSVRAGGRSVTSAFARRADGRVAGLVTDLPLGRTTLTASAPGARRARLTVTNHPNGGPVLAGPQLQPWVCQPTATDAQCNQPTSYAFSYRTTTGQTKPYDPAKPPADVATTTTDQGRTVPFVVRTETGYQDRDQYQISVLYDPAKPWTAVAPQPQFNHKLVINHGFSCGIDHQTSTAPGTIDLASLGRGFAVMSTALDNAGHNCNLTTQAESLIMAKEHLVERYGTLRYTIGTGCSGGSLTQQQVANAFPGVYQGILPQCSFPDSWSTGNQLADSHFLRLYLEHPERWAPGVTWDRAGVSAVEGHPNPNNAVVLDSLFFTSLAVPTNPCAGVTVAQRYSATNPRGTRCTLADVMVNVFGRRADGFAGRPLDDVGVQYGLNALLQGTITKAQFVDLNVKAGGADINAQPVAQRTAADEPALRNANRSGAINDASNLDQTAIIDLRGSDDGTFHDAYRAFAIRARLDREHGTHANQVIWQGAEPLTGGPDFAAKGLVAMDRWLAAVERDRRHVGVARKVRDDRPADISDHCEAPDGTIQPGTDCPALVRVYQTPRMVAGDSVATDTNKCRLKPLAAADYPGVTFTDAELAQLREVFPNGVCDYAKPAVDSETPTLPWMTYDHVGGRPLPARKVTAGWAAPAFRDVRGVTAARRVARAALARRG